MRYRDTQGNDFFQGTSEDDVFVIHGLGKDQIRGNDGFDTLKIDVSDHDSDTLAPIASLFLEDGTIEGGFAWTFDDSVYMEGIERLDYVGMTTDESYTIYATTTALADKAFDIDGAAGYDSLTLRFQGSSEDRFFVREDGAARTAVGHFRNVENFFVNFGDGHDIGIGGAGAETFQGAGGDDVLRGGGGDDVLAGGLGVDKLIGGTGADTFAFYSRDDSVPGAVDRVLDFSHADGDTINLATLDASFRNRFDRFTFIGEAEFTGKGGTAFELREQVNGDGTVTLLGDCNHNGKADFAISIVTDAPLVASDIII